MTTLSRSLGSLTSFCLICILSLTSADACEDSLLSPVQEQDLRELYLLSRAVHGIDLKVLIEIAVKNPSALQTLSARWQEAATKEAVDTSYEKFEAERALKELYLRDKNTRGADPSLWTQALSGSPERIRTLLKQWDSEAIALPPPEVPPRPAVADIFATIAREQGIPESLMQNAESKSFKFITMPAGSFMMGSPKREIGRNDDELRHRVKLTHAYEVAATATTQLQWLQLMGKNPSHFFDGEQATSIQLDGSNIFARINNPVETLTWWSALVYTNKLSRRMGLEPCYDLSRLECNGSAADGTLRCSGKPQINAPQERVYQCEGFRLPTEAEQEHFRRAGTTTAWSFGNDREMLPLYGWFDPNPEDGGEPETHPVATLAPNPAGIFDGHGNVAEWGFDYRGNSHDQAATDPVRTRPYNKDYERNLRGGGADADSSWCRSSARITLEQNESHSFVGFRVVRTLAP